MDASKIVDESAQNVDSRGAIPDESKESIVKIKDEPNDSSNPPTEQPPREIEVIYLDDEEIRPDYEEIVKPPKIVRGSAFRSVDPEFYERGYSCNGNKNGNKKTRIIVYEKKEKNKVRQYAGSLRNYWFCIGCYRKSKKHNQAFFDEKIFVVPKVHCCNSIAIEEAKKEQEDIMKKWNIAEELFAGKNAVITEQKGDKPEENEENDQEEFVEPPTIENQRKRHHKSVQINETIKSKKSKVSMDQTDTENANSRVFDKDTELCGNNFNNLLTPNNSSTIAAIEERDFSFSNSISTKPSSPDPPFLLAYSGDSLTTENVLLRTQNDTFEAVKYYRPPESFIDECCKTLGIQFDSDFEFFQNIKIKSINFNSKPATSLIPKDTSGYSCFSLFFTGTEEYAKTIKEQTNAKFIDFMDETTYFDKVKKEKVKNVGFSRILKDEHIETICQWLKCRIMVYCNGEGWQRLGKWDSEGKNYVPIFLLEKKAFGDSFVYEIVLTLKDE